MEYFLASSLAFGFVFFIIKWNVDKRIKKFKRKVYSQSYVYDKVKDIAPKKIKKQVVEKVSQSSIHVENHMIKIMVIDDMAYWVKNNIFYTAETRFGNIVDESAEPVNMDKMSKKELDKMLFILDNLDKGKRNHDSGSSRDE